jgi:hypothetical protein
MTPTPAHKYEDSLLTGLAIAERISSEWNSGHYQSVAQVTSVIHRQCPSMPRSTVFWLAYHTINKSNQLTTL